MGPANNDNISAVPSGADERQDNSSKISFSPITADTDDSQPKKRSERQREASRSNGKQSRGPKTERGKTYSRRNAWKHGMLSRNPTVLHSMCSESEEDFHKCLTGLIDYWKPIGPMEFMYVEIIATGYLRLARGIRFEKAELQFAMAGKSQELGTLPESGADQINAAIKDVRTSGHISDEVLQELLKLQTVGQEVFELNSRLVNVKISVPNTNEENRQALLTALNRERKQRQLNHDELKSLREFHARRLMERAAIPDSYVWERNLRYEKPVWRRIRQAVDDLQRLQNRRRRQHREDLRATDEPEGRDDGDRYE